MKKIRDNVHGLIEVDDRLLRIVDSDLFQRLRFITQNGMAYLVYPSMRHTRFEHSLGTMHVMRRVISEMEARFKGSEFSEIRQEVERNKDTLLALALVHDIGHLPFSHTFEMGLEYLVNMDDKVPDDLRQKVRSVKAHEKVGEHVVKTLEQELRGNETTDILNELSQKFQEIYSKGGIYSELLNNNIDVDRMDYLLRDSYGSGVSLGLYNLDRILSIMTLVKHKGEIKLSFPYKGISDLEHFILARFYMYDQVYYHKFVEISNKILAMAIRYVFSRDNYLTLLGKTLNGELNREEFLRMTDPWLIGEISSLDKEYSCLKEAILYRKKYRIKEELLNYSVSLEIKVGRVNENSSMEWSPKQLDKTSENLERELHRLLDKYQGRVIISLSTFKVLSDRNPLLIYSGGTPSNPTLENFTELSGLAALMSGTSKSRLIIGICRDFGKYKTEFLKDLNDSKLDEELKKRIRSVVDQLS